MCSVFTMGAPNATLFIFLCVCLCWISCSGKIELCASNSTGFKNETTLLAFLEEPLTVSFCVQCGDSDRTIDSYIKIEHPNHRGEQVNNYYTNSTDSSKLMVSIYVDKCTARINITVRSVEREDITSVFAVTVYTLYQNRLHDGTVFTFHLTHAELLTDSMFSQQISNKTERNFTENNNDYVTVNTTYNTARFTCDAEGNPKPHVILTEKSHNRTKSGELSALSACGRPGDFTCIARISRSSLQTPDTIQILSPITLKEFTLIGKPQRMEIRPGDDIEMKCSVDGCPTLVTITQNAYPIAETASSTTALVHKIQGVTCSHMGTYRCLARTQTGLNVHATAYLGVEGCPASLCPGEDTSRELSPSLGGKVTFSLCLMSSQALKYSPDDANVDVKFTRDPFTKLYWTANITVYHIQVIDYRIHSVRIENIYGSLDYHFTLKAPESPTVSMFSLQIYNKTRWDFVDNNADYVTVNTIYTTNFRFTCYAEGNPKPLVTITDEQHNEITRGVGFGLTSCIQSGLFTCTAKNHLGSSQSRKRIQVLSSVKVRQFTALGKSQLQKTVRPGDDVEMTCSVDGCPKMVTITRNAFSLAETNKTTAPLVHEIKGVNCSHMGTYTCLARSENGQDVQTRDLEVEGCPVLLCQSNNTSYEVAAFLGDNVTFSLCLMSSVLLKYSSNETTINVSFTRNPNTKFYWTANITVHNIQVADYRTHTVRIENSEGYLDHHFILKAQAPSDELREQTTSQLEFGINGLLIAVPSLVFIIIVFIIAGVTCHRVRAQRKAAISQDSLSSTQYKGTTGTQHETETPETPDTDDLSSVLYVELEDVMYEIPVECVHTNNLISNLYSLGEEYQNIFTSI